MSLPGQEGAERKFWRTPDLVESLLLFLDARSTLTLVKVLPLALDIVQMKSMWIKLVKRVCPYDTQDVVSKQEYLEGLAAEKMELILLTEILKVMTKAPNPRLLDLLDVICERFPPVPRENLAWEGRSKRKDGTLRANIIPGPEFIRLICTRGSHTTHDVCPYGFLLLEVVEAAMGTTKHLVEQVVMDDLEEPELMALQTRLLRQQDLGVDTRVDVSMLIVNTMESARAMSTLMQHCHRVIVQEDLFIEADIGKEGWAALAEALPGKGVDFISSNKCLASARREDLRDIWRCGVSSWEVWLDENRSQEFGEWELFERFFVRLRRLPAQN